MDIPTKLLIIEDSPTDQLIARRRIRKRWPGVEILEAHDGEEAIELLNACDVLPDAILLDINMPRMDGHEFLERYFADCGREIPIVLMLTSSEQRDDRERASRFGSVKGHIVKPLRDADLEGLRSLLAGHGAAPLDGDA